MSRIKISEMSLKVLLFLIFTFYKVITDQFKWVHLFRKVLTFLEFFLFKTFRFSKTVYLNLYHLYIYW